VKRLKLSQHAEADLEGISLYTRSPEGFANPVLAGRTVARLIAKCRLLARHPRIYRLRPEYGAGIRLAACSRYLILFREGEREIRVERILHGARDVPAALKS
jgi:plasmid stabilization system protein ParE